MSQHVVIDRYGLSDVRVAQEIGQWPSGRRKHSSAVGIGWILVNDLVGYSECAPERRYRFFGPTQADAVVGPQNLAQLRQRQHKRQGLPLVCRSGGRLQDSRRFTKVLDAVVQRSLVAMYPGPADEQFADLELQAGFPASRDVDPTAGQAQRFIELLLD